MKQWREWAAIAGVMFTWGSALAYWVTPAGEYNPPAAEFFSYLCLATVSATFIWLLIAMGNPDERRRIDQERQDIIRALRDECDRLKREQADLVSKNEHLRFRLSDCADELGEVKKVAAFWTLQSAKNSDHPDQPKLL